MTEATGKGLTAELLAWLETWKSAAQQVLSQVSGQAAAFEISPESPAAADSDTWFTVTAEGGARGEMTLRGSSETCVRLAQMFMGESDGAAKELTAEYKEAVEELLRQIAGVAATSVSLPGGKLQFQVAASGAPSWPAAAAACLGTPSGATPALSIAVQFSAALVASLQAPPPEKAASTAPVSAEPVQPPGSYDRLMDVGLEVKLRFGTRRMVLRDVLALSAGVVVELDRNVTAPVDLLLDGRIIAQGEVVVVDGKYGLKISQVGDSGPAA